MGKMIVVWGTPNCGKTTLALKLAQTIYALNKGKKSVIAIFTDPVTPTLPVLFPNYSDGELFSLGTVLSKAEITPGDVFSNMVGIKGKLNFGVLGYRIRENKYSFPEYGEKKAGEFYDVIRDLADYIVVDCSSDLKTSIISDAALKCANRMIYLFSPDIKCLSFTLSQMPIIKSAGLVKDAVRLIIRAVKAAIAGIKSLVSAIAAGGSTAAIIVIIMCIVGLVVGSVFAIFIPNESVGDYTIQKAVYDIEHEYERKRAEIAESIPNDVLIYEGEISDWKDVIAAYAVKLNLSTDDPQEVATFDEKKAEQLKNIFFDMNELTTKTETQTYTVTVTKMDNDGNEIEVEEERTITFLTMISTPKTAFEMAKIYGFSEKQTAALVELLQQNNEILWEGILK